MLFVESVTAPLGGWESLFQTFGIAVVCLFGLSLAIWRVGVWLGNKVVIPVAERHIRFLDEVAAGIKSQTENIIAQTRMMEAMELRLTTRIEQVEKLVIHTGSVEIVRPEKKK